MQDMDEPWMTVRLGTVVGPGPDDIAWDEERHLIADDVAWLWSQVVQAALAKDVLELARRGSALAARP
jgi:hypothetical protein